MYLMWDLQHKTRTKSGRPVDVKAFTLIELLACQPKPWRRQAQSAFSAFTLIELLVVISIISLLVGILLPSVMRAKGLAKTVVCSANAKGIGTALYLYADEWGDLYPIASNVGVWGGLTSNGLYSWMEQLFPFVEEKKLYVCPAKPLGSEYSYFLGARAAFIHTNGCFASVERNRVKYSSSFVLSGCTALDFSVTDCDKDDYTQDCVGFPVHEGVQNILFDDGHVSPYAGYVESEMTFRYREMGPWYKPGDPP
jgi:prepilin-type N-terminal cleavage/methylation domain-containing protein